MPLEEELREFVRDADVSRYEISKQTGIEQSQLSRFLNGQSLRAEVLEVLADYFGFEVILRKKRRRK